MTQNLLKCTKFQVRRGEIYVYQSRQGDNLVTILDPGMTTNADTHRDSLTVEFDIVEEICTKIMMILL